MSLAVDGDDPFWSVQLTSNAPSKLFAPEGLADYEDRVLPAGAAVTEHSLASVLGRMCEVSVPLVRRIEAEQRSGTGNSEDRRDVNSSSTTTTGKESLRQMSSALVLTLRHVNGDGVMSGVGGDVWCAAMLLSAWLLENPEITRGLDVLELGSGLGLCGIVAGYLARSVTLTDYIDELIVNLHHNVELNRTPRVVGVGQLPKESREPHSESQQQQRPCSGEKARRLALRPLSHSHVRVRKLDWTAYHHCARRKEPNECGRDDRRNEGKTEDFESVEGWWWDDRGPNADRLGGRPTGGSGGKTRPTATTPEDAQGATLRCDVVIGSALIYSPHHACVADVLSRAFAEGGCHAAYVVQLSTRPGFDDFLRRLESCSLRYQLHRISSVLPDKILEEIRLVASSTVVGGPVNSRDTNTQTNHAGSGDDGDEVKGEGGIFPGQGEPEVGAVEAITAASGAGFDEFVLCSVFRATAGQGEAPRREEEEVDLCF